MSLIDDFPFLASHEALKSHLQDQLVRETRGPQFVSLVYELIDSWEATEGLRLEVRDAPSDGSRDIVGLGADGDIRLIVEAKFTIERRAVLRKVFYDWYADQGKQEEGQLFTDTGPVHYVLTTLDDVEKLVNDELEDGRQEATKWIKSLRGEGRFTLLDGPRLVKMIVQNFERQFATDLEIRLNSDIGWPKVKDTRIGVVDAAELAKVRSDFGEALVFENVRPFIGGAPGNKSNVNADIIRSVTDDPEMFLARNNGVVFKATSTEEDSDDSNLLIVRGANIVNGGQTTHCVLEAGVKPGAAQVLVKVVETDDAWDITESANNQNRVPAIDLKIARFVRPQKVARDSARLGVSTVVSGYEGLASLSRLLNPMSTVAVEVDEIRALFIGTFSNDPRNAIGANYERLQAPALEADLDNLIEKLVSIAQLAAQARELIEKDADDRDWNVFKRFHKQGHYRAHHTLLALSLALDRDLKQLTATEEKLQFIEDATDLTVDEDKFRHFATCFQLAWSQIVELADDRRTDDVESAVEGMTSRVGQKNFTQLFDAARRRKADLEALSRFRAQS